MRRGLAWSAAVLGCAAMSVGLVAATARPTPEAQPNLMTSPSWRTTYDIAGAVSRGPTADADAAWLSLGSIPGRRTRWEDMVRTALLDLHQLFHKNGAVAAGAADRWNSA